MYGRAATSLLFSKKEETKPYIMFGFGEVHESREESRERPKQGSRDEPGRLVGAPSGIRPDRQPLLGRRRGVPQSHSRWRRIQATRPHLGAILREARRREPRPRRTADSLPGGVRRELLPVRRSDAHHARHLPADRRRRLRRGSRKTKWTRWPRTPNRIWRRIASSATRSRRAT